MTRHAMSALLLLPSHLLGGGTGAPRGRSSYTGGGFKVPLGAAGRCPKGPTVTTLIFDNSGSVTGGNDPIGERFAESAHAISTLARRCRCGQEKVAVLTFDTPCSGDLPATPVRAGKDRILSKLSVPSDGRGSSYLGGAVRAAIRQAEASPEAAHTLIVFSDFEVFPDGDADMALMAGFPGSVHAAVLRSSPPNALAEDDRVNVVPISSSSPRGIVARTVFAGMTSAREGAKPILPLNEGSSR